MPASAIQQRLQDNGDRNKAALSCAQFMDKERVRADAHSSVVPLVPRPNWKGPEFGASAWESVETQGCDSGFRTVVAGTLTQRERAFRLAYRVYRDCGYVGETEAGRIVSKFDAQPGTLVLLIQDSGGCDVATVSLVFDSPAGLPSDEVHGAELAELRAQGRRLAEVTRLAIDPAYVGTKTLLVQLFNAISVYGRHEEGTTDCVIEVNPRHENYYRRLLMFEPAGPARPCPRVNGAQARLLRLDLAAQVVEIGIVGGTQGQVRGPRGRTLYSHFCAPDQEPQLAAFMRSQQRPMTAAERRHFQLDGAEISPRPAQIAAGAGGRTKAMSADEILPGHAFDAYMQEFLLLITGLSRRAQADYPEANCSA